jgi:hypothetical protein
VTDTGFQPQKFGRYTLEEPIGRGGMAEVFRATAHGAHGFKKTVALKRILPDHAADPKFVQWFIDEARLMMRLEHPKIVQVLDFGEVDGRYYLAMELVRGIDGLRLLRTCAEKRQRPSPIISVHILTDVLDALHYAHTLKDDSGRPLNLIHCDVSPSNIFISELGEVKLSDFGIATVGARGGRSETGVLRGKHGYLSPEQVAGDPVDHRADVFAAGVVLAELLMMRRLFHGKNYVDVLLQVRDGRLDRLDQFGQHLQPELRQILEYALAREPRLRYQDAAAFRDALHRYLFDRQQLLRSTSVRRFMERMATPGPAGAGAAGAPGTQVGPDPTLAATWRGRRRLRFGPPPATPPVPAEGPSRAAALARLSAGETLGPASPGPAVTLDAAAEFGAPLSLDLPARPGSAGDPSIVIPDPASAAEAFTPAAAGLGPASPPDLTWDLSEASLFRVLFQLAVGSETGLLVLRHGRTVKEIYTVDGDPRFVASNVPEELFGQFLKREGVITAEELDRALGVLSRFHGHLGEALVSLKLLRPMQMLRLLTSQVRRKVIDAFAWPAGTAAFYRGRACTQEMAPLGLDAFELLEAGAEALPEETVLERLRPLLGRQARVAAAPPVPPEVFRLGGHLRQIYDGLGRPEPLGALLAGWSRGEPDGPDPARLVLLLVLCGLVSFPG